MKRALLLSLLLLHPLNADAAPQGVTTPPGTVIPSRLDPGARALQIGDQIEINLVALPDIEKRFQVRADGTFFHPFAGEVPAAGRTIGQVEAFLKERFRKQLKNPSFRVGLVSAAESEVAVLGEVRNQGKIKFVEGASVLELLAQAGGLSEKADPDSAVLWRQGKGIPVNLSPSGQAELSKLEVRNGDILYVNRGKRVGVSGEVQTKGVYPIGSNSTHPVADAIKAAGGATESAALGRVQIIRATLPKPISINFLQPGSEKVGLEDGDMVVVPARKAAVLGAVTKQGGINLVGTETLLDVISQAGVNQGRLDQVVVVRAEDVMAGTDKKEVYNLESSLQEGQKAIVNVAVRDGDVVYVPPKDGSQGLMGGGLSNIANILFMARSLFSV